MFSRCSIVFLQTQHHELTPSSSNLVFQQSTMFSPKPSLNKIFRCSLAKDCKCAFLSRGTLQVPKDFNPLPVVFLVTAASTAFKSLTSSSNVVWTDPPPFSRSCMELQTEDNWCMFSSVQFNLAQFSQQGTLYCKIKTTEKTQADDWSVISE